MTRRRVATALVFIPLFFFLVRDLPPLYFDLLVMAGALLGQQEFYRFHFKEWDLFQVLGLALGLSLLIGFTVAGTPGSGFGIFPVTHGVVGSGLFLILLAYLFFKRNLGETLLGASVILFGVVYVTWTLAHLIPLRHLPDGVSLIFFIFLVTWSGDTGAYYVGRWIGKRKLSPQISPSKTVEGAIGGLLLSLLAAALSKAWFISILSWGEIVAFGLGLGLVGLLGDLVESMLKRSGGVKDSGSIVPGHGGILDRVDSLIFTIPIFYYYMLYLRP